ncbi:hypothetical protein DM02DRAFT_614138 [Periconia macrospinosa]|uniref:Uncharacterized protein n=1 Tax=Periconia macrospinosa TaxID=97972 RepID=A0A2V1DQX6_9PLEO|nr:hypothetical protein DM02DRAFT_614138 [Periconia macrospinosa]
MKFSNAASIFLLCASAVSAIPFQRVIERSVIAQDEALAKRVAPEVTFDSLETREASPVPEVEAAAEAADLVRRDPLKDAEKEIIQYLRAIKTSGTGGIGGPATWPAAFTDLHGDNKSQFGGRYVCQVRKNGNTYEARVVAHAAQGKNIKVGYVFKTTTVATCKDKKGNVLIPGYGRAVHYLRKAFGGENPPAC